MSDRRYKLQGIGHVSQVGIAPNKSIIGRVVTMLCPSWCGILIIMHQCTPECHFRTKYTDLTPGQILHLQFQKFPRGNTLALLGVPVGRGSPPTTPTRPPLCPHPVNPYILSPSLMLAIYCCCFTFYRSICVIFHVGCCLG